MPTYVASATNSGAYSGGAAITWSGATGDPQTVVVVLFPEVSTSGEVPTGWSFTGGDVVGFEVIDPPPGWFAGHTICAYRVDVAGTAGTFTAVAADHEADIDWVNWETLTFEDVVDIGSGGGVAVDAATSPMMLPGLADVPADSILVAAGCRAFRNPTFATPGGWTQRVTGNGMTACTVDFPAAGTVADLEVDVTDPFLSDGFAGLLLAVMPDAGPPTAPGQVTGLMATGGDAQVELEWTAPSSGGSPITDYIIERAPDSSGSPGSWSTISDGTSTATTYLDEDVVNDSTYWYRVSAVNAVGTGTASTSVSATPAVPTPPEGPTLRGTSTASAVAPGAITVALPSGTVLTDTVVVVVATDHNAATTFTVPGMTSVVDVDNLGTNPIQFAVLAGTGFAGSIVVTPSDSLAWLEVGVMSWIDGDPELIVGTPGTSDGTTETSLTGVTTVDPDTPVLVVACQNFSPAPGTDPATTTVVTLGGGGQGRVLTTGIQETPGASGAVDLTWVNTGRSAAAVVLAIPTGEPPPPEPTRTVRTAGGGAWRGPNGGLLRMAGAPPPNGEVFDVWNGRIRNPDGTIFYPVGMNTAVKITEYPYVYENNAFNSGTISSYEFDPVTWPSRVAQAQAWGLNFLRVNTIVVNDDPEGPNPGDPALLADLIEHGVNELLDAGFVVMVTSHDFTGTENETILGTATDLAVKEFYSACIDKWGTNPRFWINPYNEPYAWGPESLNYWHELFEGAVDFLRGEGYTGPIVCDIPRYAQGIDVLASGALDEFATYDPGIVFGWHAYGVANESVTNTWESHEEMAAAVRARGHCVLIGECGVANPPSAGDGPWQFNEIGFGWCMDRARAFGWGFAWWHSVHPTYTIRLDDGPFWTSIDGTGLTPSGEAFWEFTHP